MSGSLRSIPEELSVDLRKQPIHNGTSTPHIALPAITLGDAPILLLLLQSADSLHSLVLRFTTQMKATYKLL